MIKKITTVAAVAIMVMKSQVAYGVDDIDSLLKMSVEDLSGVVTSVSKKPEAAFQAPAAVYVLTSEDMKYSGATSIVEALRMVPGIQVSRSDSKVWSVTSRGLNTDGFGNKLLVLIDGRSVYTPLFSGVYWDVQDTYIDDIERIEVIRGPGATLWGANAVNGVVNVITKSAKKTQTTVISGGLGKEEKSFAEARVGKNIGENLFYRAYVKRFNRDSSVTTGGIDGGNDWYANRGGFRIDWDESEKNVFTFHGDIYGGNQDLSLTLPTGVQTTDEYRQAGGNFIAKWDRQHSTKATSSFKAYFDRTEFVYSLLGQDINTVDFEVQHNREIGKHSFVAGLGYRYIWDDLRGSNIISYDTENEEKTLISGFLQDTISLSNTVNITLGSKIEENDFTGVEVQPSGRIAWTPNNKNTLWGAVSKAVRTPSRSEDDISLAVLPGLIKWDGNRQMEAEELIAHEVGYRLSPREGLMFDITGFFNDYDSLRTSETGPLFPSPGTLVNLPFGNKASAESYGIEFSTSWEVLKSWTLDASYSFLTIDVHVDNDSTATTAEIDEGTAPKNQFNARSVALLPHNLELSNNLYYVDNITTHNIEPFIRFDSRIAWKPVIGFELSLVGFNLFDDKHPEFGAPLHGFTNEIERGYYVKASWRF